MSSTRLAAALVAALTLASCETGQALRPLFSSEENKTAQSDEAVRAQFAGWTETLPAYRIGEGDKLRVMYPRTPELDEDALVRPDGVITLRSCGDVEVAGLTTAAASQSITDKAQARLRNPEVWIAVTDPISARVYVGGEVRAPGVYRVTGPMTAVEALQLASGTAPTARIDEVILLRRGPDDRPMLKLIDVRSLIEGKMVDNPRILPGDILFVPRSRIAELGLWVEQFIEHVVPFQRNFNYTIGRQSTSSGSSGF